MLDIRDLTTGEAKGSGLYEELMRTSDAHIKQEFEAGRLQGESYAQVYLSAMQANLQASIQYLLSYETTNKNLEILDEQIKQNEKQNELLDLQKEQLRIANETAQYNLDNLLPEQYTQALEQTKLLKEQNTQAKLNTTLLTEQIETVGVQQQVLVEQFKSAQAQNVEPTGGLLKVQYDKGLQEVEIGKQKVDTERSQTKETNTDGSAIEGLVGKEKGLKTVQTEGFNRQAEVQAAKIYSDVFNVMYSTEQEGLSPQDWGMGSDESFNVFRMLNRGIGIDDTQMDNEAADVDTPTPNPM